MVSDGLALAIALFAAYMARSSSLSRKHRHLSQQFETWAALANGVGLLGMAGLIAWEAYSHWQAPPNDILSLPMLVTAIIGLIINGLSLQWLQSFSAAENGSSSDQVLGQDKEPDLNIQGALLHVLADVLGSVGVILAAIAVWMWGWTWADDAISIGLAVLIGGSAIPLIRQSIQELRVSSSNNRSPLAQANPLYPNPNPSQNNTTALNRMGFCEIGQTSLLEIVQTGNESGAQSSRPQNADN